MYPKPIKFILSEFILSGLIIIIINIQCYDPNQTIQFAVPPVCIMSTSIYILDHSSWFNYYKITQFKFSH